MQLVGIVGFIRKRIGLPDFAAGQDIRKVAVEPVDQFGCRRVIETNHQVFLNESVGMKIMIKFCDFFYRRLGAGVDSEKVISRSVI